MKNSLIITAAKIIFIAFLMLVNAVVGSFWVLLSAKLLAYLRYLEYFPLAEETIIGWFVGLLLFFATFALLWMSIMEFFNVRDLKEVIISLLIPLIIIAFIIPSILKFVVGAWLIACVRMRRY